MRSYLIPSRVNCYQIIIVLLILQEILRERIHQKSTFCTKIISTHYYDKVRLLQLAFLQFTWPLIIIMVDYVIFYLTKRLSRHMLEYTKHSKSFPKYFHRKKLFQLYQNHVRSEPNCIYFWPSKSLCDQCLWSQATKPAWPHPLDRLPLIVPLWIFRLWNSNTCLAYANVYPTQSLKICLFWIYWVLLRSIERVNRVSSRDMIFIVNSCKIYNVYHLHQ